MSEEAIVATKTNALYRAIVQTVHQLRKWENPSGRDSVVECGWKMIDAGMPLAEVVEILESVAAAIRNEYGD